MEYKIGQLILVTTRLLFKGSIDFGGEVENVYMLISKEGDVSRLYKINSATILIADLDKDPKIVSHRPYDK